MNKSNKLLNICLYIFYIAIIGVIVGFIIYTKRENQYFSLKTNNVDMIVDSEYQMLLLGRDGLKDTSNYTYESENESVATVSNDGTVHAVSEGQTNIIVKSKKYNFKDTLVVNIEGNKIYSVTFDNDNIVLYVGDKYTPKVLVNNSNSMNADIVWSNSNSKVASIEKGKITALKEGTCYLTATIKDTEYSSKIKVTVLAKKVEPQKEVPSKEEPKEETKKEDNYDVPEETINDYIAVSSVNITSNFDTLDVGDKKIIKYEIVPNNATNKNVKWSSNNSSVVSVDKKGYIKALKAGTADITIKTEDGNKKTYITINVKEKIVDIKSIKLSANILKIHESESSTLKVTYSPSNATNKTITWSSSNPEVATVDSKGKVKALKVGSSTITANTKNGKKAECNVIVEKAMKEVELQDIKMFKNSTSITEGGKETMILLFEPDNASNVNITWSSSNSEVATVDQKGNVNAIKEGTTIVTATASNGKSATCEIRVDKKIIEVQSLSFNRADVTLEEGGSASLVVVVNPNNATNQNLKFNSSNESVVTVNQNGLVKAINEGTATITATSSNGKTASCNIKVNKKVIYASSITLNTNSKSLVINESFNLVATINPSNTTNKTITWASSDSSVASVDANGKVVALKEGTSIVTATTSNGKMASCTVSVSNIKVQSITLNTSDTILQKGKTLKLNTSISPSNASNKSVKYTSSNNNIASVDSNGLISAKSYGVTTIKAAASDGSGKYASFKLTVTPNANYIDIRDNGTSTTTKYKVYRKNILTNYNNSPKHIQNFAIANVGTSNEVIFLSTTAAGNYSKSSYTKDKAPNLTRTLVFRATPSTLSNPNRPIMYLNNSGHGQQFDIEPNSSIMWINANGYEHIDDNGTHWGYNHGIMRIKFATNKIDSKISPLVTIKNITNASGTQYDNLQPSVDKDNDLIIFASRKKVLVFKYSDYQKGIKTQIYEFTLNSKLSETYSDGKPTYNQGIASKNGYIYQAKGYPGKTTFIEAFNFRGESIYLVSVKGNFLGRKNTESEGIKIYNNKIYIGSTHNYNNKTVYDIGYFK